LTTYYLRYLQQIADETRSCPQGITLTAQDPLQRAAQLQEQIQTMGIPEFVRRCAAQDGQMLPDTLYESFREEDLLLALQTLAASDPAEPPKITEPDGPRSAYEVLLDCCSLDEKLLYYFIDILRRKQEREFQTLALVTTRKAFTTADFLGWFAQKHLLADEEEMICVTLMDACLDHLAAEGQKELMAALLCGDQTTFELFRCEAPELVHLPKASYDWFARYYLGGYYPIRYMLKYNGVSFPEINTEMRDTP
jgi:hypothetical protein